MIILDTNVISELLRPEPEPQVEHWLATQDGAACYLTTVCEAELRYGLALLPEGKKRVALSQAIEAILNEDFQDQANYLLGSLSVIQTNAPEVQGVFVYEWALGSRPGSHIWDVSYSPSLVRSLTQGGHED